MNMVVIDIHSCRSYHSPEACPNGGSHSGDAVGCIFVGLNALRNGNKKEALPMRTKLLLTAIAALLLATGTAHADCCDMAPTVEAGPAFYAAAKRQFGRGFSSVGLYGIVWQDYSGEKRVLRSCKENSPPEERKHECDLKNHAVVVVKDRRYLGLEWDKSYLMCQYRTKPVRFFNCIAWEGE